MIEMQNKEKLKFSVNILIVDKMITNMISAMTFPLPRNLEHFSAATKYFCNVIFSIFEELMGMDGPKSPVWGGQYRQIANSKIFLASVIESSVQGQSHCASPVSNQILIDVY